MSRSDSRTRTDDDDQDTEGLTVDEAFERFDEVVSLGYSGAGTKPRVHDADADCRYVPRDAEPVAPHKVPLTAAVCRGCDPTVEIPRDKHQGVAVYEGRRICGCMGCTEQAFVIVEHPEHGQRAACPAHRRDYPVVEEVDNA